MLGLLLFTIGLQADTIATSSQKLDEVVVVSRGQGGRRSAKGQVASIDEHLKELKNVSLVRRGSYAWEPVVNNMATERVSTTIDGMKIFYACTDKMDPVTSYVESSNLQSILLNSGLNGNPQATGNIGGALDLKLRRAGFNGDAFRVGADAGYESNGHLQVYGADAAVSTQSFYNNGGVFYRDAGNYKEGGGREVLFSQFRKVNVYDNFGFRLPSFGRTEGEYDAIEGTFIFDRATNVGYPALNMDVAKAEAFITSLSYKRLWEERLVQSWETKAYYNHITHVMDDTTRPDVAIHMDMPGKSWTAGLYSLVRANKGAHELTANYDLYYNRLFADMTMYPGGAAPMYMVTWPDVGTLNTGVALSDDIRFPSFGGTEGGLHLSAKLSWQHQRLNNDEGYKALSVFFPGMQQAYHQTTGRIAANFNSSILQFLNFSIGMGWGSRAPTVTEAYGYYLNNTFDQYDYIGNPRLKNESAIELNTNFNFSILPSFNFSIDGNCFFFSNYIIGQFENRLSAMTVGAEGVKVYGNIDHATIANASLTAEWRPVRGLRWSAKGTYSIGRDDEGDPLPLIAPFTYQSRLSYATGPLSFQAEVKGHVRQAKYGQKYGETETAAWTILNLSANYQFTIHNSQFTIRSGIENLFDKRYATYADWCHIPQKGRNIYVNLSFEI
jgi:iron complex outermembrane receptor protein